MAFIGAVGTVSVDGSNNQTGDIMQGGSNSNGYYVKFADGTLICHDKWYNSYSSPTFDSTAPWTSYTKDMSFAHSFSSSTSLAITTNAAGHYAGAYYAGLETRTDPMYYNLQTTYVKIYIDSWNQTSFNYFDVCFMAIGRWYT